MAFENWTAFVEKVKKDTEKRRAAGQEKPENKRKGEKKHDRYNSRNGKP